MRKRWGPSKNRSSRNQQRLSQDFKRDATVLRTNGLEVQMETSREIRNILRKHIDRLKKINMLGFYSEQLLRW